MAPHDDGGNRTALAVLGELVPPSPTDFAPLSHHREVSAEPAPQLWAGPVPAAGSGERDKNRN